MKSTVVTVCAMGLLALAAAFAVSAPVAAQIPSRSGTVEAPAAQVPPARESLPPDPTFAKVSRLWQWALRAQFSDRELATLRAQAAGAWLRPGGRTSLSGAAAALDAIQAMTPDARAVARESVRSSILSFGAQHPQDSIAGALSQIYYSRHRPLANGSPPLTDIEIIAVADLLLFMNRETGAQIDNEPAFRRAVMNGVVTGYWSKTPAEQRAVFEAPSILSQLRLHWARATDGERTLARQQFAAALANANAPASTATAGGATPDPQSVSDRLATHAYVNQAISDSMSRTMSMASHLYR